MNVSRHFLSQERARRDMGLVHGSAGVYDACATGADRSGLTEKERAGYDFAHDLAARDGFAGFHRGSWQDAQATMLGEMIEALAEDFAVWSVERAKQAAKDAKQAARAEKQAAKLAKQAAREAKRAEKQAAKSAAPAKPARTRKPRGSNVVKPGKAPTMSLSDYYEFQRSIGARC